MRLDQYTRKQMNTQVDTFFMRLQHTNPFPAQMYPDDKDTVHHTYLSLMPFETSAAIRQLMDDKQFNDVLDKNRQASLQLILRHADPDAYADKDEVGTIKFEFRIPMPSMTSWIKTGFVDLTHSAYGDIIAWYHRAKQIDEDTKRCCKYVKYVIEQANTIGQVKSLFPDYVHMLQERQQRHLAGMQKRSPLPKGTDAEYLRQDRQFVSEKIAMCLLMPEGDAKIWVE